VLMLEFPGIAPDLKARILKQKPFIFVTSIISALLSLAVEQHLHFIFLYAAIKLRVPQLYCQYRAKYAVLYPKR
jgi:hypothetical protein